MQLQADPRHQEILAAAEPEASPVSTSGRQLAGEEPLDAEVTGEFRSSIARPNCHGLDRTNIAFQAEEMC